jgi:hypothetical protein
MEASTPWASLIEFVVAVDSTLPEVTLTKVGSEERHHTMAVAAVVVVVAAAAAAVLSTVS